MGKQARHTETWRMTAMRWRCKRPVPANLCHESSWKYVQISQMGRLNRGGRQRASLRWWSTTLDTWNWGSLIFDPGITRGSSGAGGITRLASTQRISPCQGAENSMMTLRPLEDLHAHPPFASLRVDLLQSSIGRGLQRRHGQGQLESLANPMTWRKFLPYFSSTYL